MPSDRDAKTLSKGLKWGRRDVASAPRRECSAVQQAVIFASLAPFFILSDLEDAYRC